MIEKLRKDIHKILFPYVQYKTTGQHEMVAHILSLICEEIEGVENPLEGKIVDGSSGYEVGWNCGFEQARQTILEALGGIE